MLAALVPAYAIAILMPAGPDDGCPSPRQVNDALGAHLPAVVLPLGHAMGPTTLRLAVATDAGGAMRLDLTDPEGGPLLHRWLPAVEHSRGIDCAALAETAALIVERYWHEVGYDVAIEPPNPPPTTPPPPTPSPEKPVAKSTGKPIARPPETAAAEAPAPPPPPASPPPPLSPARTWIGAAGGERLGDAGTHEATVSIAFAVERSLWSRRIGLRLSAGADRGTTYRWTASPDVTDRATLREVPLRMGVYLSLPFGPGQIEPGLGVDLDVISAAVSDPSGTHTRLSAGPGGDAALAWSVRFRTNLYFRLIAAAGAEVPYRFVTTENQSPFWSTPRVYLDLGLELGFWFP